ncbi:DUF6461 domain-containing protein [Sphaerisporangium sp. NBC_01403]|uniref:DUF6461 domain-containing protein n=1 Tax=Sphaerisporangium sp. NBC_01403 TaxID=2903599 RepID=UPI00324894D6
MSGTGHTGYDWFSRSDTGYCFTFVRDLTPEEALRRIGVELLTDEDDEEDLLEGLLLAQPSEGGTLLIEENGYAATMDQFLRPLSAGTVVASVFRNVNFDQTFVFYEEGEEILSFDPQFPGDSRSGSEPDRYLAEMRGLGLLGGDGEDGPKADVTTALVLAESLTGVRGAGDPHTGTGVRGILPDY